MLHFNHRCIAHCDNHSCSHQFEWDVGSSKDLPEIIECPVCFQWYKLDQRVVFSSISEIFTVQLTRISFPYHDFDDESLWNI